jgi:hypothetical protein
MIERGWDGRAAAGFSLLLALAAGAGCSGGDDPHDCDAGTPTCESTLLVLLPDPRIDFNVSVKDELGLDLQVRCPLQEGVPDTAGEDGAYSLFCAAGRLQIDSFRYFGDHLEVQLEQGEPRQFEPRYSMGADYCGNTCTQGSIQL